MEISAYILFVLFVLFVAPMANMKRPTGKKSEQAPYLPASDGADGATTGADADADAGGKVRPASAKAKAPKATLVGKGPAHVAMRGKEHVKRGKVVRDTFTMPKSDYEKIGVLKQRCLDAGIAVKKSELLRAGLLLLESASTKRLLAAVSAVETVRTGRPPKSR